MTEWTPPRLELGKTYDTTYCIELWLRDEQVKVAIQKVKERIEPHGVRDDPVAVVGFGPSLVDTWEKVKEFKHVITCSGAHQFLLARGVVPTWHVEVDPRAHKIKLLGTPHPDVVYLPSSTCHPAYLDHLIAHNAQIKLWHVFSTEEDAVRTLPRGEWALTGGADAGLRAIVIARFFGFRDLHVFGMDGSYRNDGTHATAHPHHNSQKYAIVEYDGIEYHTTQALLECSKAVWHELNMLKDTKATFYGDGLTQAMAKKYVPDPPKEAIIALVRPEVISAEFRELNSRLHRDRLDYGVGGGKHADTVKKLVAGLVKPENPTPSVLDYGCGKGYLAKALPFPIWEYDPAIVGKDELPRAADLVVCTDVLEHIEPENLWAVLEDLQRCVKQVGYLTIHTGPAQKRYADGRNTHLIQRGKGWWEKKLSKFFKVAKVFPIGPELHVVVGPPATRKKPAAKEVAVV